MFNLRGHSALVTGSSSGIGLAIARKFAEAGANVVFHGLEETAECLEAMEHCRSYGVRTSFIASDLLVPTQSVVEELWQKANQAVPNIDILVNNAGGCLFDVPYEQMTLERFEQTIRLNLTVPYWLTHRFALSWIERGIAARVLMIGSINGRLAEADSTAYDTAKGGVEMMVKTLCVTLAPRGIRVNGVAPGLVLTTRTRWLAERPHDAAWLAYHTPDGQIPGPECCAPAALYLVSDAAEHVHGQMLLIDGGMSALQQPPPMPK